MTSSEDLSTRRLMRRHVRELRWQWQHGHWRNSNDYAGWGARKKCDVYNSRLVDLNYSYRLLGDRGWPMPAKS